MEQPQYHLQSVVHAKESLEDFDGPLDVILLLLSKNKIEIQDVSISSILEQYLAWLDERKRVYRDGLAPDVYQDADALIGSGKG